MLDAILYPEWEYRYSFDAEWGPEEELALMRNGSGDDYAIVCVKGATGLPARTVWTKWQTMC
jgi:hypothetical protein